MQDKLKLIIDQSVSDLIHKLKEEVSDNVLLIEICHLYKQKIYGIEAVKIQKANDIYTEKLDRMFINIEKNAKQSIVESMDNLLKVV